MTAALKRAARRAWLGLFPHHPYEYLGRMTWLGALVRLLPRSYVADVEKGVFTGRGGLVGALVRGELERRYYGSSTAEQQQRMRELWGGEAGRAWHAHKQSLYQGPEGFGRELAKRQPLVDALVALVARDQRYHTVCELGTGNGLFLQALAARLPGIRRFVGIDLSVDQIAANRAAYRGERLEFEAAEATDWIAREGRAGTIFIACGTLECLNRGELSVLLDRIASLPAPVAAGIVEPLTMDLNTETESRPRGAMTFSHHYPKAFEASGFRVLASELMPIDVRVPFYNTLVLLAEGGQEVR